MIAYEVLLAKFTQNEDLKKKLLETGDAYLVECAGSDKIWACGKLQFKARGPKEASKMLREVFETRHISMLDLPENISLDLRYLHLGEAKKIGLNGAVLFVEALRE